MDLGRYTHPGATDTTRYANPLTRTPRLPLTLRNRESGAPIEFVDDLLIAATDAR
jgi:hypothetical protein